ncbi:hypothetical protein P4V54_11165 [Brevibacillus nitrificans]|uniref:hypothetical protein n=1 Tax=Brevibacillus nitrificans TaxID=651560 RepID=UPI002E1C166C|nr:hypothetical protein [Brevibacillus nitrificans]
MILNFFIVVVSGILLYMLLKPPNTFPSEETQPPAPDLKPVLKYSAPSVGYMAATLKQYDPVFNRHPVMINTAKSMANNND